MNIQLGQKVRDKITGFAGTVTGHCEYISGCNQTLVVPGTKEDGSLIGAEWFDDQRLEVTDATPIVLDNSKTPGFDKAPPRRN